jgi:hypothetical protein
MIYYKIQDELTGGLQIGYTDCTLPDGAIELTVEDRNDYIFNSAKEQKLKELNTIYNSQDIWLFTLKDGNGNTLTKEQDWFLLKITKNVFFQNDTGEFVTKHIEDPDAIKTLVNNKGAELLQYKLQLEKQINEALTMNALATIDIHLEFAKIDKNIVIK